jgi:hypothetical protein
MRHELSSQEIIHAGQAHATRDAWERAREFTWALYDPSAARVTYSQTTVQEGDHRLRTMQLLAFDGAGSLLPYDFSAPWWGRRDLPEYMLASAWELTQDDLSRGLGGGFPDGIREELRAFAEECLGVETLHTWRARIEGEMPTWMFDLTAPPALPYAAIVDDAGASLTGGEVVAAGREREALVRWTGTRDYVHALYGEHAVRTDVTAFSRYNDFTYDRDIRLDVFDAAGARLFYDLRLPWWERFAFTEQEIAAYAEEHDAAEAPDTEYDMARGYEVDVRARDEIERLATLLLGVDFIATRSPWDSDTTSYDLTRPPELRFPRLWVEERITPARGGTSPAAPDTPQGG